jgi:hypothetical protein
VTTEQIEKLCAVGKRKGFNAVELSQYVTDPPYSLSVADASKVYYAYKNRYNAGTIARPVVACPIKPGPVAQVARVVTDNPPEQREYSPSILNRSAVKLFALEVSRVRKANKFRRVAKSFVQAVEADVEAFIKDIARRSDDIPAVCDFLNRKAIRPKVETALNEAIRKIIIRKVCANNVGKTLK